MLPGAQVNAAHIVPSRIEAKGIHLHAKTPRAALLLEHWSKWRVTVPVEDILQRKELVAEWILGHNPNRGAEVLTTESTPDREDTSQQDDGVEIISAQTEFKASESEDGEQTSSTVPNTPELEDGTQASAPVSSTPEPEAGMPNSPTMPVAPKPKDVMDISCAHTEDDEVTHPVPEVEVQPRDISESTVPRPTSQSLDSSVDIQPFDCDEIGESCFPTTEQLKAEHKRKYGEIPEIFEWTFPFWAEVEKHRIVAQNYHVMGKRMKSRIEELERQVKKLKQENGALKIR